MTGRQLWLAVAVVFVGAFFRLYRLDELPPGLFDDVGMNGLDVRDVLAGRFPIFFERNYGREALFIYWQALLVAVAGSQPLVMHFAGAAMGIVAVALAYRLFADLFGHRVALLAAMLFGTSLWAVMITRVGLRTSSLPPLLMLTLLLTWRTLRRGTGGYAIAAGVALGLTQYTYVAARLMPLLMAAIVALEWRAAIARWRQLLVVVVIALAVFAPTGAYLVAHRDEILRRAADVSVFNPTPEVEGERQTWRRSLLNTAGMLFVAGDVNRRHNVPGRPIFDPITGALFVGGIALALWRARSLVAYRWPLAWLGVMSLASGLAHEAPNTFRTLAAAPAAFIFPALSATSLAERWRWLRWLPALLAIGWAALTFRLYFGEWAAHPDSYKLSDGHLPRIAAFVESRPEPVIYMSIDRRATISFLSPRALSARWYREESFGLPVPRDPGQDVLYVSAQRAAMAQAIPAMLPGVEELPHTLDPGGGPDFLAFRWSAPRHEAFTRTVQPILRDMLPDFRLDGYRLDGSTLLLFWQQLAAAGPYDLYAKAFDSAGHQVSASDVLVWPIDAGPWRDEWLVTRHEIGPNARELEIGAVHRDRLDRARLVGGPIGEAIRLRLP